MKRSIFIAMCFLAMGFVGSTSYALPPQLNAFAGASYLNVQANSSNDSVSATRETGNTFGVSLTAATPTPISIEAGIIRLPNSYQVPVIARLGGNGLLTGGLGAYMNTRDQNNREQAAFGALAALGINIGINDKTLAFAEGRALRSFERSFFTLNDGNTDSLLLAGLRLALE